MTGAKEGATSEKERNEGTKKRNKRKYNSENRRENESKDILDTPPTKPQVTPQVTALVTRAFQMQQAPLHEPFHFQPHAGVDEAVKMPAGVFEGERIGVDEMLGDEEVDLGWERCERWAGPFC